MNTRISLLGRIIGTPESHALEDRIFNAFAFLLALGSIPPILGAIATKSTPVLWSMSLMPPLGAFFYYMGRFRGASRRVQVPYLFFVLVFATLQWFFHGGLMGGPPIAHLGMLVVSLIVVDTRLHFRVIVVAAVVTALTYIVELRFPELVTHLPTERERHLDLLVMFAPLFIALGISVNRLKQEYDNEKHLIEEKNRRLAQSEAELLAAKSETDNILLSINEGLMLVGRDYRIGTQHSRALEEIFPDTETGGLHFSQFIAGMTEKLPAQEVDAYLALVFSGKLKDAKVARLNPLEEITVNTRDGQKDLRFRLNRIRQDDRIAFLLVVIADVTHSNRMAREAEQARKLQDSRTELVYSILQIEPDVLAEFIEDGRKALERMNASLREDRLREDHIAVLEMLYREIHNMKGNAGLLKLRALEQICHGQEARLKEVYDMSERDGRDFLQSVLALKDLSDALDEIAVAVEKIRNFSSARTIAPDTILKDALTQLCERVARDEGRQAHLELRNMELARDFKGIRLLKDALIQLLRNAIVHGIETAEERRGARKPPAGTIIVELSSGAGTLEADIHDDGRGIDLEALRERARESGRFADPEGVSDLELAKLIFEPGVSTRREAGIHGGRGVGLDFVKKEVTAAGGSITVEFKRGRMTRFRLKLPA